MSKPVARHILDTRAVNKIMNILEGETAETKRRILDFLGSSIAQQASDEFKALCEAQQVAHRQPGLFDGGQPVAKG
jgi:hypothetical protein